MDRVGLMAIVGAIWLNIVPILNMALSATVGARSGPRKRHTGIISEMRMSTSTVIDTSTTAIT